MSIFHILYMHVIVPSHVIEREHTDTIAHSAGAIEYTDCFSAVE